MFGGEVKIADLGDWAARQRLSIDSGIAAWGDELFVCDPYTPTIRVFDLNCTVLRSWTCNVRRLRRIAVQCKYVVVTCLSEAVLMYCKNGRLIRWFADETLDADVVLMANDEIYVTDRSEADKSYVQIFTTEGEKRGAFLCCSGTLCRTDALSASEEELYASYILFDDRWRSFIRVFQRDGVQLRTIEYAASSILDVQGTLALLGESCVSVDANGTLLLRCKEGGPLAAWNPDGSSASQKWFPPELPEPWQNMVVRLSCDERLTVIYGLVRVGDPLSSDWKWNRVFLMLSYPSVSRPRT